MIERGFLEHLFEEVDIADPPKIGYDPLDPESGFLYRFTNLVNLKIYLGVHKGRVDDGYWNSSENKEFKVDFGHPNSRWKYEVLQYGLYGDMTVVENEILKENNAVKNDKFYNDSNGSPKKKKMSVSVKEIENLARDINNNWPSAPMAVKELLDDNGVLSDNCQRIQSRVTDDDKHQRAIRDTIDDNAGRTSELDQYVVLLEGRTYQNIYSLWWLLGGNHTLNGTNDSKHGTHVNVKIIPKSVHEKFDDASLKSLSNMLNAPLVTPRKPLQQEDVAKELVEHYFDRKRPLDDPENDELMKAYNFNSPQRNNIKKKALVLLNTQQDILNGKVWINWKSNGYKQRLEGLAEDRRDKYTMVLTATSGHFDIGIILSKVRENYQDNKKKSKPKLLIIVTHPNSTSRNEWDIRDLAINRDHMTWYLDDKGIDLEFYYPVSYENDFDSN